MSCQIPAFFCGPSTCQGLQPEHLPYRDTGVDLNNLFKERSAQVLLEVFSFENLTSDNSSTHIGLSFQKSFVCLSSIHNQFPAFVENFEHEVWMWWFAWHQADEKDKATEKRSEKKSTSQTLEEEVTALPKSHWFCCNLHVKFSFYLQLDFSNSWYWNKSIVLEFVSLSLSSLLPCFCFLICQESISSFKQSENETMVGEGKGCKDQSVAELTVVDKGRAGRNGEACCGSEGTHGFLKLYSTLLERQLLWWWC